MDDAALVGSARPAIRSAQEARALVVEVIQHHAETALQVARRHSLCADDAHDAYQRGVEIFLRHAATLDADRAHNWLLTTVKREAWEVRRQRRRIVGEQEYDLDLLEARTAASPEDRVIAFEDVAESADALRDLKPNEVTALWLKASGRSYAQIAEQLSWTETKVNRCLAEGRARLRKRLSAIQEGAECERWLPVLSAMVDGEASVEEIARARPHLRHCAGCRAQVRQMHEATRSLAMVFPVALAAADASHGVDPIGIFVRVYEAATAFAHERVAASAIKLQALTEAASAGKVAAVAASAAALAGGGAVVAGDVVEHRAGPARAEKHPGAGRASRPVTASLPGARSAAPRRPASSLAKASTIAAIRRRTTVRVHRPRPRPPLSGEFGAEGAVRAKPASAPRQTAVAATAPPARPAAVLVDRATPARDSGAATREFAP